MHAKKRPYADALTIVHAEKYALENPTAKIPEKNIEKFTERYRDLVNLYLRNNRPVYFTRISSGVLPEYLREFHDRIIWIERDMK